MRKKAKHQHETLTLVFARVTCLGYKNDLGERRTPSLSSKLSREETPNSVCEA